MHIILQALCFELQLVVFCLQDTLSGALFFNLFGMFDQEVILLHLGKIALFSNFDQLSI